MSALLVDNDTSEQFTVTEPVCKIGSASNNNIVLTGEDISSIHVRIEKKGEDYFVSLEPGGAAMKKFLFFFSIPNCTHNGNVLQARPNKLANGDKILIGSRLLRFHIV
jgi:hypothetical protein